jgi:hypothetical protein
MIIKALKGSREVKSWCEVFEIHRSNYKHRAKQIKHINPQEVKALAIVKIIYEESNSSAGV